MKKFREHVFVGVAIVTVKSPGKLSRKRAEHVRLPLSFVLQANSLKKEHEQDDSNGSLDGGKGGGFRCNLL